MHKMSSDNTTCAIMCILGKNFTEVYKAPVNYDSYCFTNNPQIRNEVERKNWIYIFVDMPVSEDYADSSLQSKYVKFLQFLKEDKYKYFNKYTNILYFDHKLEVKDVHIQKILSKLLHNKKSIYIKKYKDRNIWTEAGWASKQERYLKFMPQTMKYVLEKLSNGYSADADIYATGIIFYRIHEKDVRKLADEMYNDLIKIGTSECQIVWALVSQKYMDIIYAEGWDNIPIRWEMPQNDLKRIIKLKKIVKCFIPYGMLKLWWIMRKKKLAG